MSGSDVLISFDVGNKLNGPFHQLCFGQVVEVMHLLVDINIHLLGSVSAMNFYQRSCSRYAHLPVGCFPPLDLAGLFVYNRPAGFVQQRLARTG